MYLGLHKLFSATRGNHSDLAKPGQLSQVKRIQPQIKYTCRKSPSLRDCSLLIGSMGPVFCGKDPMFLSHQQKFPKTLVSRQWKEGKKSMSCIITLYSHCAGGTTCNEQQSLPLTAGG